MNIESVAVSALHFDPANARKHGDKNLAAIKGSRGCDIRSKFTGKQWAKL
jgi:hypothetical protein